MEQSVRDQIAQLPISPEENVRRLIDRAARAGTASDAMQYAQAASNAAHALAALAANKK